LLEHLACFGVFFVGGAPVDFDGDAMFGTELTGRIVCAGMSRFEEWVALDFAIIPSE